MDALVKNKRHLLEFFEWNRIYISSKHPRSL